MESEDMDNRSHEDSESELDRLLFESHIKSQTRRMKKKHLLIILTSVLIGLATSLGAGSTQDLHSIYGSLASVILYLLSAAAGGAIFIFGFSFSSLSGEMQFALSDYEHYKRDKESFMQTHKILYKIFY